MAGVSVRKYGFSGVSAERARELDAWLASRNLDRLLEVAADESSPDALHLWPQAYAAMGDDLALEPVVERLALRADFPSVNVDDRRDALSRADRVRSDAARLALVGLVNRSWSGSDTELVVGALSHRARAAGPAKIRAACAHAIEGWLRFGHADERLSDGALALLRQLACDDPEPLVSALSAVVLVRSHGGIADLGARAALSDGIARAEEIAAAWNALPGGAWVFDVATPDPPDGQRDVGAFRALLSGTLRHAAASRLAEVADWLALRAISAEEPARTHAVEQLLDVLFGGEPMEEGTTFGDLPIAARRALEELAELPEGEWTRVLADYALPATRADLARFVATPLPDGHRALLEGLDELPWAQLEHAYGSAEDVPALLRALASRDEDRREAALDAFYMGPVHQGSRYSATVAAVPFVVELILSPRVRDRHRLLELCAHIALGYPSDLTVSGRRERELEAERRCYEAIGEQCPLWLELTRGEEDERTRITAAALLGFYPAFAERSSPRLRELVIDVNEPEHLRASALLALSHLGAEIPELTAAGGERVGAARAITCARRRQGLSEVVQAIARGVSEDASDDDPFWSFPWGDLERHLCAAVALFEPAPAQDALEVALAEAREPAVAGRLCRALLELTFGRSGASYSAATLPAEETFDDRYQTHKASAWSTPQRRAILAVVRSDAAWAGAADTHHADLRRSTETQRALRSTLGLCFYPTRKALGRA